MADVTLPDVDGNPVRITGSGRKTAVVTWWQEWSAAGRPGYAPTVRPNATG
jgi:hypothetical protein